MNEGLGYACRLDGAEGAAKLSWEAVRRWKSDGDVLWLHFDDTGAAATEWLTADSGLDPLIAEALCAEATRPRATAIGDGMPTALRGVNLNPGADLAAVS